MKPEIIDFNAIEGEYEIYSINPETKEEKNLFKNKNKILYYWADIVCQLLLSNNQFVINGAYLEYENVANPVDPVSIPTVNREDGISYYQTLTGNRDFLRLNLASPITIDSTPDRAIYFNSFVGRGNRLKYTVVTTGHTQGVRGVPFSHTVNSKICGLALVSKLNNNWTDDVIFSRGYFNVSDQILKTSGLQIGVRWKVAFK
jgi:hypothetical protein